MEIKVLGTGCSKCNQLENIVKQALAELNIDANIIKEEKIDRILHYGVMRTPGLVINEKVVLSGRIATINEIKDLILKNVNSI